MNSVIEVMERDHRGMEILFRELDSLKLPSEKAYVFSELASLFEAHGRAEEAVVYPLLNELDPTELWTERAKQEHFIAREQIHRIQNRDVREPAWMEAVQALRLHLSVHISEEEGMVFPRLRELLTVSELNRLSIEFRQSKGFAVTFPDFRAAHSLDETNSPMQRTNCLKT